MECDCRAHSGCTDDAVDGSWLAGNSVQMGAFTVVGYLLYRFSQSQSFHSSQVHSEKSPDMFL